MSALQVITNDQNIIKFNHDNFSKIINHNLIGNKEICIISITGAFRKGKSFILNYLLKYLNHSGHKNTKWIDTQSIWTGSVDCIKNTQHSDPLEGFIWKGGEEATTEGISIWSEPYILTNSEEKDVAVLLMDTQGSFNSKDNLQINADIFALSTLLSSVQIINDSSHVNELNIQTLEMFTSYSRNFDKNKGSMKPFQRLVYLIRDFQHPMLNKDDKINDGYGLNVGSEYWKRYSKENTKIQNIQDLFESFECYVMPHPGEEVLNENFNGTIEEIKNAKFVNHIRLFTEWMFFPNNLVTKKIIGKSLPNQKLIDLFKYFDHIFKDRKIPPSVNLMEAHFKIVYEEFEDACIDLLESDLRDFKNIGEDYEYFFEKMTCSKTSLINKFDSDFQGINSELKKHYRVLFEKRLLLRLQDHYKFILIKCADYKKVFEEERKTLMKDKESFQEISIKNSKIIEEINSRLREKDDLISINTYKIKNFEEHTHSLEKENSNLIEEKNKAVEEKDKVIESAEYEKNLVINEQKEVLTERKKITDTPDTEIVAKSYLRSMTAYLTNESNCIFHLIEQKAMNGVWIESTPYTLLKNERGKWATGSNGLFDLSTSGKVMYHCKKCDTRIVIEWDIPFWGDSVYKSTSSNNHHSIDSSGEDGYKVVKNYYIR